MKKVSIKEVAQQAGVSVTTVSHILNNNGQRFSEETVKKVLEVRDRLGYSPNKYAQQLRGQSIKAIGVLLPSLTNPFFSKMMQSMDNYKASHIDLFFLTTPQDQLEDNIKHLVERGIDGMIIAQFINHPHRLHDYLLQHHIPYVVLDQSKDNGLTDVVRTHEYHGGQLAAEHLATQGYDDVAIVQPYQMMTNMETRKQGFLDYFKNHQLPQPYIIQTELSKQGGLDIVETILSRSPRAIFAINDELAIGILRGFNQRGLSVPRDVAIIGYDDIEDARFVTPSLTTISQPIDDIGKTALTLITKKLDQPPQGIQEIELPTTLVVREST